MKVKSEELKERALDWAVSKASGGTPVFNALYGGYTLSGWHELTPGGDASRGVRMMPRYGRDWSCSGPLLDKELVETSYSYSKEVWYGNAVSAENGPAEATGHNKLIAGLRAYVAAELGEEIDVPDELK